MPSPAADAQKSSFGEVGMHNGMNRQDEVFVLVVDKIAEILFDLVFEDQRGRDLPGAITGGTNLLGIDRHLRFHALSGDLHQPELGNG